MPRERLFLSCLAQPLPQCNVPTVGTPIPVNAVFLPPAVHPAGTEAPVVLQVKFHPDVRNQRGVVKQIGLHRHIEWLTGRKGTLYVSGILLYNINGVMQRLRRKGLRRLQLRKLAGEPHGGIAHFGEEMPLHVAKGDAAVQRHQLLLAVVRLVSFRVIRPLGRVPDNVEHFGLIGNVGTQYAPFQLLPVIAVVLPHVDFARKPDAMTADVIEKLARAFFVQLPVQGERSFQRGIRLDAEVEPLVTLVGRNVFQPVEEALHAGAVPVEGRLQLRFTHPVIDLHRVGLYLRRYMAAI